MCKLFSTACPAAGSQVAAVAFCFAGGRVAKERRGQRQLSSWRSPFSLLRMAGRLPFRQFAARFSWVPRKA
eukprot:14210297-Heterocapsa_arctica.AAC.1